MAGLQLTLSSQNTPLKAFTYALAPMSEDINPVKRKVLVTEEVKADHVTAHKLEPTDKLAEVVANYRKDKCTKAVVIVNTVDSLLLEPTYLEGLESSNFPVLIVTHPDGQEMLEILDREDDVLCDVEVESTVDKPTHHTLAVTEQPRAGGKGGTAYQDNLSSGIHVHTLYGVMRMNGKLGLSCTVQIESLHDRVHEEIPGLLYNGIC